MTMAMSSALPHLLLLINPLVLDHVFNNALHCTCILESLLAKPHLQPYHEAPTL